ncbi:MAG: MG2 domain-containing protein [Verrucomicrobia bacterium]|nr:MG2 domain-containing protein [Verrucomicrobiota bacterium]
MIVRNRSQQGLSIPEENTVSFEILDPQGQLVQRGNLQLNEFGSGHDEYRIPLNAPLGMYSIRFEENSKAGATVPVIMFRVEEFRLPEFTVEIHIGAETSSGFGTIPVLRSGEAIEGQIEVAYYFGGPVADASIELTLIEQSAFISASPRTGVQVGFSDGERVVQRQTLQSDSRGRVVFSDGASGGHGAGSALHFAGCGYRWCK